MGVAGFFSCQYRWALQQSWPLCKCGETLICKSLHSEAHLELQDAFSSLGLEQVQSSSADVGLRSSIWAASRNFPLRSPLPCDQYISKRERAFPGLTQGEKTTGTIKQFGQNQRKLVLLSDFQFKDF